jgi:hypothetical protein
LAARQTAGEWDLQAVTLSALWEQRLALSAEMDSNVVAAIEIKI